MCLGYRAEGKELFLNVTAFRGFILAVGSRGIQALQVITAEGETSKWFGRSDESPRTQRLAHLGSIAALEAGFDVSMTGFILSFLIVSLRSRDTAGI